jgi:hypothetical protein
LRESAEERGLTYSLMIDRLRTLLARLIVKQLPRPRPLLIRAWLWLSAEADLLY